MLTSNTVASVHLSLFKARSPGESTSGSGGLSGRDLAILVDRRGVVPGEPEAGTTINFH